tara:strand:- start:537 stop:674 length:138 start_codon:yes stop_codon:yes gene_type:complete
MNFWIILWKIVFLIGLFAFILMFVFVAYKGALEIRDLLKNTNSKD